MEEKMADKPGKNAIEPTAEARSAAFMCSLDETPDTGEERWKPLFADTSTPHIETETLPAPPDTLDEIRSVLEKREQQISAIQRLGRTLLIRTTDFDRLMKQTLHTAIDILDADVGSVQIYDEKTNSLIFRHVFDPAAHVLVGYSVPISKGIDGRVFRTGVSDLTNRVRERKEWNADVDSRTGYHTDSMLTVPLRRQDGAPIGVIQILNGKRPFDQRDLEVLEVLCSQAGQAMISAHLYDDAQRRLNHLQALRSIDIAITASLDLKVTLDVFVEQVMNQLKLDAVNVLLLNTHLLTLEHAASRGFRSEALRHTSLRLGEGLAGRAALERRVIAIPNLSESTNDLLRSPYLREEGLITYYAVPLIAKGQIKGVLETFHRTRLEPDPEWLAFLETLAGQAAIAVDNAALFNDLQKSNTELALAYDTTIEGWSSALDLRDKETEGHTLRVTELTIRLARAMGINENEMVHIRRGALLHDIGKMGIPDLILLKPGPLTDEEWVVMRKHPVYALDLLSKIPYLRPALDIPYYHHEKWDGSGYPSKLKGEQIPLSARIFAVADVWDALRSDRPYRKGWPAEKASAYILSEAGQHFDPKV
jgi:putative nucleotidyltransferase with HDIG domain